MSKRPMAEAFDGGVEGAPLVRFTRAISAAQHLDQLGRAFRAGFGRLLGVPMYGFYALEPGSPQIQHNVAVNVSDVFVARYKRAMDVDPLLSESRERGKSIYNLDLMTRSEWEETAVYRLAYSTHAMRHVAETPIAVEGEVLGALHFAASHPDRGFAAGELHLAEAVAQLLALSIDRIRTGERAAQELKLTRAALDLAGTAVVVSEPGSPDLCLNAAARRLMQDVVDADERVHDLLAFGTADGRFSRRAEVRLGNGAAGVLHAQCARMLTGELVIVLELQREHARIDHRLVEALTQREGQVATLVVEGLSDREIAERLMLSHYTVSQHLARVYRKLGVASRVALTRLLLGAPAGVRRS